MSLALSGTALVIIALGWGLLGLAPSLTSLAQQLRQLGNVGRDPPRLIFVEPFLD